MMLTDRDVKSADDRRIAVELQLNCTVPLDSTHVLALIVPDEMPSVDYFEDFITGPGKGIEVVTCPYDHFKRAKEYQATLEERVIKLQKSRRLV